MASLVDSRDIQASIVRGAIYWDPISGIDTLAIGRGGTDRERTCTLDPTILPLPNVANLPRHFRKILILTEDQSHVEEASPSEADYIDRDANVNAFFSAFRKAVCVPSSNWTTLFL